MSKPYTEADLSDQLTADRTWRIKEISDLKATTMRADKISQKVLLRALVTICYAHWEGYVRLAAQRFLEYIAVRKLQLCELDRQFTRNHFLPRLSTLTFSKPSMTELCALVDTILDSQTNRYARVNEKLVNTQSNLSYEVLMNICTVCGIASSQFKSYDTFIDKILLKRRNSIAHGEDAFVQIGDIDEITTNTVELIRHFGTVIENKICLQEYKAQKEERTERDSLLKA